MKNNLNILAIFFFSLAFLNCTNSKPVRPEKYSVISVSPSSLDFISASQKISLAMKYVGGYGTLAWYVSSKPDWVELQPNSGYLTNENQYITASLNAAVVATMAQGSYSGIITIYSSEGSKNIPVSFIYSK